MTTVPVTLCGVFPLGPENFLCALLKWEERDRFLPVWLPPFEGAKLAARLSAWEPNRPDTAEVLFDSLDQLGGGLARVEITSYYEGVFMCQLTTESGTEFDCRVSDALTMAKLFDAEIEVDETVLAQASIRITPEDAHSIFGLDIDSASAESEDEESYSASGDAQADADFQQLMKDLGVEEGDLAFSDSDEDDDADGDDGVTPGDKVTD